MIAELTASALFRKPGGSNLPNTHTITPATMAKLIHLKISVAPSLAALPPSSAAFVPTTAKRNTNRILTARKRSRFRVIELLSPERRDAAEPAGCAEQSRRKVERRRIGRRAQARHVPPQPALSLPS